MPAVPSGAQFEIRHGTQRATVVEVGAAIREYVVNERPVLDPFPHDAMCDGAHGTPLIPWANRLADGRYRFDGHDYQVPLTEPEKQNAIHGLVRWRNWQPIRQGPSTIEMGTRLHPSPGYPFTLDLEIAYTLSAAGLTVEISATNMGTTACPYACGQHPYMSPGAGLIDQCTLQVAAKTRILSDPVRQLPTGLEAVAGTAFDFEKPRPIGEQQVDFAFTDLTRDQDNLAWARLGCPDGRTVALWVDAAFSVLELYTGDTLAPHRQRRGLGTEPMTGPPNGLQSGAGLIRLESGQRHTSRWGVRLD
ncbi:MAG: aldose 1-epimerase family protein [Sulfobacillus sp.]